jgi:hypothetical protein
MYTGQEYSVFIGRFLVQEECDDTKGVIRIRKSKKNRQHNGQKKKKGQKDKQRYTKHTHMLQSTSLVLLTATTLHSGGNEKHYINCIENNMKRLNNIKRRCLN